VVIGLSAADRPFATSSAGDALGSRRPFGALDPPSGSGSVTVAALRPGETALSGVTTSAQRGSPGANGLHAGRRPACRDYAVHPPRGG
jgi:hypothetical protein